MRVFIAGIDGYIGWALAQYLAFRGHFVYGVDNLSRRGWVKEVGGKSVIPIGSFLERAAAFKIRFGSGVFSCEDFLDYKKVVYHLDSAAPDAIVHLAEMPSAPYSMLDAEHAVYTQHNNVNGTLNILYAMKEVCPNAHLVKLGSMGEYGYYNMDIPEGFFEVEYKGRKSEIPFPKRPSSFYHLSKVHDSHNIVFACDTWGLRSTDIMQGIVYGSRIDEMGKGVVCNTRLDIDACFGTVLNRFCGQAVIGTPLTLYGSGKQRRGFLPLCDSVQCLTIVLENPPEKGEYRVFNQFEEVYCLEDLANMVVSAARYLGISAQVSRVENPRVENETQYYNPEHKKLLDLGYKPLHNIEEQLICIMRDMVKYKNLLYHVKDVLMPDIRWDGTIKRSEYIDSPIGF